MTSRKQRERMRSCWSCLLLNTPWRNPQEHNQRYTSLIPASVSIWSAKVKLLMKTWGKKYRKRKVFRSDVWPHAGMQLVYRVPSKYLRRQQSQAKFESGALLLSVGCILLNVPNLSFHICILTEILYKVLKMKQQASLGERGRGAQQLVSTQQMFIDNHYGLLSKN